MMLLVPSCGIYRIEDDQCVQIVDFSNFDQAEHFCKAFKIEPNSPNWPGNLAFALSTQWKQPILRLPTSNTSPPVRAKPISDRLYLVLDSLGSLRVEACVTEFMPPNDAIPGHVIATDQLQSSNDALKALVRSWFDGEIEIRREPPPICPPYFRIIVSQGKYPGVRLDGDVPNELLGGARKSRSWRIQMGYMTMEKACKQAWLKYMEWRPHVIEVIKEGEQDKVFDRILGSAVAESELRRKSISQ